jgi:phage protein U
MYPQHNNNNNNKGLLILFSGLQPWVLLESKGAIQGLHVIKTKSNEKCWISAVL